MGHDDSRETWRKIFEHVFDRLKISAEHRAELFKRLERWQNYNQDRFVELGSAIAESFNGRYDIANEAERKEFAVVVVEMSSLLELFAVMMIRLQAELMARGVDPAEFIPPLRMDFMEEHKIQGRIIQEESLRQHPGKFNWKLNLRSEANI